MFNCDVCGECCRNLHKSPLYKDLHSGDGICRYLKGNICLIYNNRPLICRIDECYEAFFKNTLSYDNYIQMNNKYCKELKKQRRN